MDAVTEDFTPEQVALLSRHVTNTDRPVFALVGLPEVVKGALFARYSRSPKSLRRLLVDEFAGDLRALGDAPPVDPAAAGRAQELYGRIFDQFGDDSVAQLGGAHVAVEQASNLLTKQLEWGRLAAYLEQSTRYIAYDDKPGGRYRYHRPAEIMASPHADAFVAEMDAVFDAYAAMIPPLTEWATARWPKDDDTSPGVYRATIRAKVCDLIRGVLPAATASNVGIFASGQAYENLLLRLAAHPLAEMRQAGAAMLTELRQVIPAFLTRVDRPDRGGVWSAYLAERHRRTQEVADRLLAQVEGPAPVEEVTLAAHGPPDAEDDLLVGMLYPHSHLSEAELAHVVAGLDADERRRLVDAYVGRRENRRHRPGRALERPWYRFDILSDYGAFRDLQRHRMATITWQELTPAHGYDRPAELDEAGCGDRYDQAMERQAALHARLAADLGPTVAQYAVGLGWRLRYSIQLNARAAMQMIELRTTPQGHPSYRRICQRMHDHIARVHPLVAATMTHVDHGAAELERLEAERRAEARRLGSAPTAGA